jgi:competence protein ComEC
MVLRVDFGKSSVLLTADIEADAEERLVRRGADLHCTVLKVAHHGSPTSTSPDFLAAAGPKFAMISCGRYNKFGHPGAGVLSRLDAARIGYFRTDVNGAVEIDCDQASCRASTYR